MFPTQHTWAPQRNAAIPSKKPKTIPGLGQDKVSPRLQAKLEASTHTAPAPAASTQIDSADPVVADTASAHMACADTTSTHTASTYTASTQACTHASSTRTASTHTTSIHAPLSLKSLGSLVYAHDQLRNFGCLFSDDGELIGYGDPKSPAEFQEMLRIGPGYDEEWTVHFSDQPSDQSSRRSEDGPPLWADLSTLKKILQKEGIEFDSGHNRFPHGDVKLSVMRLCKVYDDRFKLWTTAMLARTSPALIRLLAIQKALDEANIPSPTYEGGFPVDDIEPVEKERRSFERPRPVHRDSGTPRHIGWRFSNDWEPRRESMDTAYLEEMVEDAYADVHPSDRAQPFAVQPCPETTTYKEVHNGQPPLYMPINRTFAVQSGEVTGNQPAAIATSRTEVQANSDGERTAAIALDSPHGVNGAKSAKKKSFRTWLRSVRIGANMMVY